MDLLAPEVEMMLPEAYQYSIGYCSTYAALIKSTALIELQPTAVLKLGLIMLGIIM